MEGHPGRTRRGSDNRHSGSTVIHLSVNAERLARDIQVGPSRMLHLLVADAAVANQHSICAISVNEETEEIREVHVPVELDPTVSR
jgi:predicted protein tyrosine phosphatase